MLGRGKEKKSLRSQVQEKNENKILLHLLGKGCTQGQLLEVLECWTMAVCSLKMVTAVSPISRALVRMRM